jgi:hypothetical protein
VRWQVLRDKVFKVLAVLHLPARRILNEPRPLAKALLERDRHGFLQAGTVLLPRAIVFPARQNVKMRSIGCNEM